MSDIERIALLVNYKASAAGRTIPNMADIDAAMNDVLPTAESVHAEKSASNQKQLLGVPAGPLQRLCRAWAMALNFCRCGPIILKPELGISKEMVIALQHYCALC